jgi:general secretion pathway protein D
VTTQACKAVSVIVLAVVLSGCAAGMAFRRGDEAARRMDWDAAVVHYRQAVQADPDKPEYKIALERASLQASRVRLDAARQAEAQGELDVAAREYRRASEYDPSNRLAASKAAELERTIRERIEASRPKPPIQQMRERARQASPEPELSPTSPLPRIVFNNASVRDILNFIGSATGINVTFSADYRDPPAYSIQLEQATLEEALRQILSANNLFYKVLNERTILVIPDTAQNRARHEEQVVRVFHLSHADATEVAQLLNTVLRIPGVPIIPTIAPNKARNTITVRGTAALVAIMERVVEANDRPSAEVVLDVQILEVNRNRAKQFGLDLSQYSINAIFSPEVAPTTGTGTGGGAGTLNVPPFNANIISQGISAADWYLTVPQALVRFLESDTHTRLMAKPQLRGQEGQKIRLDLGDEIPVPQTTFGSFGGVGSIATQPISSYQYRTVGIIVEMTPRVTFDGDVVLELTVESSTLGSDVNIAGQNLPSFGTRKVATRLRLRDGESTLLAGLLREDERRALRGIVGLMRLPGIRNLFSSNDNAIAQTDIVMLLTPHIVRTHELRQEDVSPIHIGTQQNLGLGGPPPLIAPAGGAQPGAPGAQPGAPDAQPGVPGTPTGPGVPDQPGTVPGTLAAPGVVPAPPPAAPAPQPGAPDPTVPGEEPGAPGQPPGMTPPEVPGTGLATPTDPAPGAAGTPPQPGTAPGVAQIVVTPPGTEFRVGGGPYTVPVSVTNAPRVSTLSVAITYNPALLQVRSVQEGSFMRQGGVQATFTRSVDATTGRIDITVTRAQDLVGASGSGLLAAVLFDAVAPGAAALNISGAGTGPAGSMVNVQGSPVTVTVR